MWNPPVPGPESVSPILAGRFLTAGPPEKLLVKSDNGGMFLKEISVFWEFLDGLEVMFLGFHCHGPGLISVK